MKFLISMLLIPCIFLQFLPQPTNALNKIHVQFVTINILLIHCCASDKIQKNEMGRACNAYGEGDMHVRGFWWGNLRERDQWGDPGVDGRIILRGIFRKWDVEGMDWLGVAQDRDRWRALVNAVMNLRVS
jgi:hypothetical protein